MSARKPPGAIDGESGRFRVFCGDGVFFVRVAQKQQPPAVVVLRRRQSRLREKRRARWKPTTMMRKRDGTCRATDDEDIKTIQTKRGMKHFMDICINTGTLHS